MILYQRSNQIKRQARPSQLIRREAGRCWLVRCKMRARCVCFTGSHSVWVLLRGGAMEGWTSWRKRKKQARLVEQEGTEAQHEEGATKKRAIYTEQTRLRLFPSFLSLVSFSNAQRETTASQKKQKKAIMSKMSKKVGETGRRAVERGRCANAPWPGRNGTSESIKTCRYRVL